MAALGVTGSVRVPRVVPKVRVEMPGVVLAMVPPVWLKVGLLLGSVMPVLGSSVVSDGVVKGSDEAVVSAGVVEGGVGGEVLSFPMDVLDLSKLEAPVAGLEEWTMAVVVESVVGSSAEVSVGVREVE